MNEILIILVENFVFGYLWQHTNNQIKIRSLHCLVYGCLDIVTHIKQYISETMLSGTSITFENWFCLIFLINGLLFLLFFCLKNCLFYWLHDNISLSACLGCFLFLLPLFLPVVPQLFLLCVDISDGIALDGEDVWDSTNKALADHLVVWFNSQTKRSVSIVILLVKFASIFNKDIWGINCTNLDCIVKWGSSTEINSV